MNQLSENLTSERLGPPGSCLKFYLQTSTTKYAVICMRVVSTVMCPELQVLQNLAFHVNNQILSTLTFSADLMKGKKKTDDVVVVDDCDLPQLLTTQEGS